MLCPNITLPEWQEIESALGEEKAYEVWVKNGYEIPESLEEAKSLLEEKDLEVIRNLDPDNKELLPTISPEDEASIATVLNALKGTIITNKEGIPQLYYSTDRNKSRYYSRDLNSAKRFSTTGTIGVSAFDSNNTSLPSQEDEIWLGNIFEDEFYINEDFSLKPGYVPQNERVQIDLIMSKLKDRYNIRIQQITVGQARAIFKKHGKQYRNNPMFLAKGVIYYVGDSIKASTLFHEIMHPFVRTVMNQNVSLYENLKRELLKSDHGRSVLEKVIQAYPDYTYDEQIEEAIVQTAADYGMDILKGDRKTTLLEHIIQLLNEITFFIRSLVGLDPYITTLNPRTSIGNLVHNILDGKKAFKGIEQLDSLEESRNSNKSYAHRRLLEYIQENHRANGYGVMYNLTPSAIASIDAKIRSLAFKEDVYVRQAATGSYYIAGYKNRNVFSEDYWSPSYRDIFEMRPELETLTNHAKDIEINDANPAERTYTIKSTGEIVKTTLTQWVRKMFTNRWTAQEAALNEAIKTFSASGLVLDESEYGSMEPSKRITIDGVSYNINELAEHFIKTYRFRTRNGRYVHAVMEKYFAPSKEAEIRADEKIKQVKDEDEYWNDEKYDWLKYRPKQIARMLGLDYDRTDYEDPHVRLINARVETELPMYSKVMGVATTSDILFQRDDTGQFILLDFKTGGSYTKESHEGRLIHYGLSIGGELKDNPRDLESLVLAFRAMMIRQILKEQGQDAKFERIALTVLDKYKHSTRFVDVDLLKTLKTIEKFMTDETAEHNTSTGNMYKKMYDELSKDLFDYRTYGLSERLKGEAVNEDNIEEVSDAQVRKILTNIYDIQVNSSFVSGENLKDRYQRIKDAVAEFTKLHLLPDEEISSQMDDISVFKKLFGSVYDIHNPYIRMVWRQKEEADRIIEKTMKQYQDEFEKLMDPIAKKYNDASGGTLGRIWRKWTGYHQQKLFGWMFETVMTYKGEKLKLKSPNNPTLDENQKKLLQFIQETQSKAYKYNVNQPVSIKGYGQYAEDLITWKDREDLSENLEDGFFAVIPMAYGEFSEGGQFRAKPPPLTRMRNAWNRMLENYFLDSGFTRQPDVFHSPAKYMGNDEVRGTRNHSMNMEAAFLKFMEQQLMVKYYNPVLALGYGVKTLFETNELIDKDHFKNTNQYLLDQLRQLVLKQKDPAELTRGKIRVPTFKDGKLIEDHSQWRTLNMYKLLLSLKNGITYSVMWLKPAQGAFNTALITMLNVKNGIKGNIASKLGIPPEQIDYNMQDLLGAHKDYLDFLKWTFLRKPEKSKLWQACVKLGYFTDNYDFKLRPTALKYGTGKLRDSSWLFFFHRVGEDYGQMVLLGAQLRHMKHEKMNRSIWDSYDDDFNWKKDNVDRGEIAYKNITKTLNELTTMEVIRMKRISQLIHGGYRQSERVAAEITAWGQWALQFKKYMPSMMFNLIGSKYIDDTIGYLKKKEGTIDTYEWISRVNQGRASVLFKYLAASAGMKGKIFGKKVLVKGADNEYRWEKLDSFQKMQLIDLSWMMLHALAWWIIFTMAFDDDDKNKYFIKRLNRLLGEDLTQGVNPKDVMRNLQSQTVLLPKAYQVSTAFYDFFAEGVIGGKRLTTGRLPGEMTLRKNIPPFAQLYEYNYYMHDNKVKEEVGFLDLFTSGITK